MTPDTGPLNSTASPNLKLEGEAWWLRGEVSSMYIHSTLTGNDNFKGRLNNIALHVRSTQAGSKFLRLLSTTVQVILVMINPLMRGSTHSLSQAELARCTPQDTGTEPIV